MNDKKFDPSIWNLGLSLGALALGCGPLVPVDGETDTDPTDPTDPSGPSGPSTVTDPTNPTDPTDPTGTQCPDVPCPQGYICNYGVCEPDYYCDEYGCCYGYDDGCCYGEDGCCLDGGCWYDCYGLTECGYASFCEGYGYCNPIPLPPECPSFPETSVVPVLGGAATSLAFVNGNGDAARELVVAMDNSISVVPGGGGPPTFVFTDEIVLDVAAGDLDSDGDEDIASIAVDGVATLLLNDGAGDFGTVVNVDVGSGSEIDLGDFDGNGYMDLLIGQGDGVLPRMFVGLPGLEFQPAIDFVVFSDPRARAVGALDLAPAADLVIQDSDAMQWWFGDGSPGGDSDLQVFDNYGISGVELVHAATGDFDGNGVDDVVRSLYWNGWILVDSWWSDTIGEMDEWGYPLVPYALDGADVNGDGVDDLLIATESFLGVRYGTTAFNGYELFGCFQSFGQVTGAYTIATGDFDGNGREDVAFADGETVSMFSSF
ncbi:MAG TPA: VCBS repeat-containing protein [Nannocystaceae bacterium]|nr:VCBS repeat-containing protein [Nannocystaceae bacterium]